MKVLIADPLSEKGHVNFNLMLIKSTAIKHDVIFLSHKNYISSENLGVDTAYFSDNNMNLNWLSASLRGRITYFKNTYQAIKFFNQSDCESLIFSSYENISMGLLCLITASSKSVVFINHNNLDQAKQSKIKKFFLKKTFKLGVHCVMTKASKDFLLKLEPQKNVYEMPHPLHFPYNHEIQLGNYIFSPSSTFSKELKNILMTWCADSSTKLLIKGDTNKNSEYIIERKYFKNYMLDMQNCKFVLFLGSFDYRVSGVVIEALSLNKHVVAFESKFIVEMKGKYPSMLSIINSIDDLASVDSVNLTLDHSNFLEDHSSIKMDNVFNLIYKTNEEYL